MIKIIYFTLLLIFFHLATEFIERQKRQVIIHNLSNHTLKISYTYEDKNKTEDEMPLYRVYIKKNNSHKFSLSYSKDIKEILYLGLYFIKYKNNGEYYYDETLPSIDFIKIYGETSHFCEKHIYIDNHGKIINQEEKQGFCLGNL